MKIKRLAIILTDFNKFTSKFHGIKPRKMLSFRYQEGMFRTYKYACVQGICDTCDSKNNNIPGYTRAYHARKEHLHHSAPPRYSLTTKHFRTKRSLHIHFAKYNYHFKHQYQQKLHFSAFFSLFEAISRYIRQRGYSNIPLSFLLSRHKPHQHIRSMQTNPSPNRQTKGMMRLQMNESPPHYQSVTYSSISTLSNQTTQSHGDKVLQETLEKRHNKHGPNSSILNTRQQLCTPQTESTTFFSAKKREISWLYHEKQVNLHAI